MTRNILSRPVRAICGAFVGGLVVIFWFFAPLTYGSPGLTSDEVKLRKLFDTWTLHFAK